MKSGEEALARSLRLLQQRQLAAMMPSCLNCPVRHACVPRGLGDADCAVVDQRVERRFFIARGEHLYWMNQEGGQRLYALRSGHFKVYQLSASGAQRVASFQGPGDILGLDSIGGQRHRCGAVALSDSVLCEFFYPRLSGGRLQEMNMALLLDRVFTQTLWREQRAALLVRVGKASQKLARFLLIEQQRQQALAAPEPQVQLPMTREDIGDYLGLMPETVSRVLHRFERAGLVRINRRQLRILDLAALRAVAKEAP